jgi:lipoate-protein ligase B
MPVNGRQTVDQQASLRIHLLGSVAFEACLELQHRLVDEAAHCGDGTITLLLCEHPLTATIGRQGSRAHLRGLADELERLGIEPIWVNRGGGAWLHAPGQLAVYPIVPLRPHHLSVGQYLSRLQAALSAALAELHFEGRTFPDGFGTWGRTGQVAAIGVAVKHWVSYFGAYVNVSASALGSRSIESDPDHGTVMSSLAAELRRPVRMATVREALARSLAAALGCERCHFFTGHPSLSPARSSLPCAR